MTHPNPNPNGLFGIAALMLDYNDNSAIDTTAKSHYSYYQLTTHNKLTHELQIALSEMRCLHV